MRSTQFLNKATQATLATLATVRICLTYFLHRNQSGTPSLTILDRLSAASYLQVKFLGFHWFLWHSSGQSCCQHCEVVLQLAFHCSRVIWSSGNQSGTSPPTTYPLAHLTHRLSVHILISYCSPPNHTTHLKVWQELWQDFCNNVNL